MAITSKRVKWILDADVEGFFDTIDHDWLLKFLERRIGDPRILRLISKWLTAGVSEDGQWSKTTVGTPQGAVISFLPGVSNKAANSIRETIRSWRIGATRNNQSLEEIASFVNPFVRGWVNSYGRYYPSALTPVLRSLERSLVYWVRRKLNRFRYHQRQAVHWLGRVAQREPHMFVLWAQGVRPAAGQ